MALLFLIKIIFTQINTELNILIRLTTDNNLIFRKGAVGDCTVILCTKFGWWCPKIICF